MRQLLGIARVELNNLLSDRGAMLVLVLGSLFYGLFYPLPYREQAARDLPIVVVDSDHSATSRQLTRMLDATEQMSVTRVLSEPDPAQRLLRDGNVFGIVEIPRDFEKSLLRGEIQHIGVWGNAAYMLAYSQIANGASNAIGTFGAGIVMQRKILTGVSEERARDAAQPLALDVLDRFNPGGGYGTYVVPAVLVLILQQTLLIAVGMVGISQRNQVCFPDGSRTIWRVLLGRALVYFCIHLLLLLFFLSVVYGVYDFPRHAPIWLALVSQAPFLLAVIFLGFSLSELFDSRETVLQTVILLSVPMLFMAGFAWPVEAIPAPLAWLGRLFPSTLAIDCFVRVNQMGASLTEVAPSWLWLWGQTLVYGVLAGSFMRLPQDKAGPQNVEVF